jgi:hypothetical protein
VLANIIFTFGDAVTMFADQEKRADVLHHDRDKREARLAGDTIEFGTRMDRAFEHIPIVFWEQESYVIYKLQELLTQVLTLVPHNWTFATRDPASATYGPDSVLPRLKPTKAVAV